ncbi:MAG: hypothetical protein UT00_C0006G0027 [Parcubacteria group bacterium GW2011_GWA1_38_7]|nr:MAG: hypothetical protein UT00_C0006G0027 [Parcubacteria group bacterium GW2011_GWA1_38_7]
MAGKMAKILDKYLKERCLLKKEIPPGILADANKLCKLVLEGARFIDSSNPPVSLGAYTMAITVVERVVGHYPDKEDISHLVFGCRLIRLFAEQIEKSENAECLRTSALTVEFMSKFFSELHKLGEEVAYPHYD